MSNILIFLALFSIIFLILWLRSRAAQKKREEIEEQWGQPVAHLRNFQEIGIYHELLHKQESNAWALDEITWHDLDMDTLFTDIDRTASCIGRQYLYALLHRPANETATLAHRQTVMDYFKEHPQLRVKFHLALEPLFSIKDMYIPHLFLKNLPDFHFSRWLTLLPIVGVFGSLLAGIFFSIYFYGVGAIIVLLNMAIGGFFKQKYRDYLFPVFSLRKLFAVRQQMDAFFPVTVEPFHDYFASSQASLNRLQGLRRLLKWLPTPQGNPDSIPGYVQEVLNQVFLFEVLLYSFVVDRIREGREDIHAVYRVVGELDALMAAASYRSTVDPLCTPTMSGGERQLRYQQLCHPLVDDPVPNDFAIHEESALITGSNMSGKSTFLKALGVSQILAQTLYFCHATQATLPFVHVVSSMRRDDDLVAGKSFYLKEVERVKLLLDTVNSAVPQLVLLDEIFRGTNTIERIAASREVLRYLNSPTSIVCAATHDIELAELLEEEYVFFHFREEITQENITFDYTIRRGVASTRNAIAILELMKYPANIVQEAYQLSTRLAEGAMASIRIQSFRENSP